MMKTKAEDRIQKVTTELNNELLLAQTRTDTKMVFTPVPHPTGDDDPVWQVRLDLAFDSDKFMALEINDEVVIGRGVDGVEAITLFDAKDAEQLGVSRSHALLRPTENKLYILDMNSTNGTWLNGHSIGVNMPYALNNGDYLKLGQMEFMVRIITCPAPQTSRLSSKQELVDVVSAIGQTITAQLNRGEVLKQALGMIMQYTSASEAAVWLVDEQTGELFLEAGRGMDDVAVRHIPVTDTLPGEVLKTGQPLRINRSSVGEQIKIKTDYLVEAVIYVPLALGGVNIGVISAAQRKSGEPFSPRDEKVVMAVADFTAVAVQNARLSDANEHTIKRSHKIMAGLEYAVSYRLKSLLKSVRGYSELLETNEALDADSLEMVERIHEASEDVGLLVDRMAEVITLYENPFPQHAICDLNNVVPKAVDDLQELARQNAVGLNFQIGGNNPYLIQGDPTLLYQSVCHLIDNAIRYTPHGLRVSVSLIFCDDCVLIRVSDSGPGIPHDILPDLFERYHRSPHSDGIGLGLEFVRATVEAHRGVLSARNLQDYGAEFMITLPGSLRYL